MKKEFNLSDKRAKLIKVFMATGMDIHSFIKEVEKQDKEFIKRLKIEIVKEVAFMLQGSPYDYKGVIDKLAGAKFANDMGGEE